MKSVDLKKLFPILIVIALLGIYFVLKNSALADLFTDMELLIIRVKDLGVVGPLLVIGLMVLAIVFNPLPSAPIALAAGAVYGHSLGTIYIVTGAEIGAIVAFLIARVAGYEVSKKYLGNKLSLNRFGSQKALMTVVFISRLIPFMSFDLISYMAGLSPLKLWRFAVATLLGLIPVSFALAHLGGEVVDADSSNLIGIILALGLVTAIPLIIYFFRASSLNDSANQQ